MVAHTKSLVESVDIYPTLCELAGLPAPQGLDGSSFAAVIKDPSAPTKDAVLHVYPRGKLLGRAVRTARYRLVEWKVPGEDRDSAILELYDYQADPGENKNLAAERPEVVKEMRAILDKQPEAKLQIHGAEAVKKSNTTQQKKRSAP